MSSQTSLRYIITFFKTNLIKLITEKILWRQLIFRSKVLSTEKRIVTLTNKTVSITSKTDIIYLYIYII